MYQKKKKVKQTKSLLSRSLCDLPSNKKKEKLSFF